MIIRESRIEMWVSVLSILGYSVDRSDSDVVVRDLNGEIVGARMVSGDWELEDKAVKICEIYTQTEILEFIAEKTEFEHSSLESTLYCDLAEVYFQMSSFPYIFIVEQIQKLLDERLATIWMDKGLLGLTVLGFNSINE